MKEVESLRSYGGYGADTDILVACAKAYLAAINKMLVASGDYGEMEEPAVQSVGE
jgi:2-isopropylmalate synthase